jgi:hypothetical protein
MYNKKNKVGLSENSLEQLMQETYNDILEEKNKALSAYKRYQRDIEDNSDIAMVGKIANDLLKIVDSAIDKKIRLIKIQADILYRNHKLKGSSDESENIVITEEDKKWAEELLKKQSDDFNTKEYE